MITCLNCGTLLKDDALFCKSCGKRLADLQPAAPLVAISTEEFEAQTRSLQEACAALAKAYCEGMTAKSTQIATLESEREAEKTRLIEAEQNVRNELEALKSENDALTITLSRTVAEGDASRRDAEELRKQLNDAQAQIATLQEEVRVAVQASEALRQELEKATLTAETVTEATPETVAPDLEPEPEPEVKAEDTQESEPETAEAPEMQNEKEATEGCCPGCGAKIDDDMLFCGECGARLKED